MARTQSSEPLVKGSPSEQKTFSEVNAHYNIAKQDLEQRVYRTNGFNDADKMFASYIDQTTWPYNSLIFDPRPWTVVLEKSARLVGNKPKGRLVPREGGDTLGAYINNELLNFQWDDVSRIGESMISKWLMMDMNVRKYGAAFAICKWRCEYKVDRKTKKRKVYYDGPDFQVCNPRDVLANPGYSYIKNWFQHREYVTLQELESVNDAAKGEPVYKNLDVLKDSLSKESKAKGARRTELLSKNKQMRGLDDYTGQDEVFKTIEIITEYRNDRWITIVPSQGVVIRDIPNPYDHGEIPVVMLKYYPLPDDLYGVNEYEPVSSQIKAINAHASAFSDTIALALRPPLHINPINVRMHTIEWNPEAKWLMNNPNVDVQSMRMDTSVIANYQTVYSVLVSSLLNAWGETSQGVSNISPFEADKTATEVKDSAFTRNVRDNMNQVFLSEALKRQIMLWHSMNQQFMFSGTKEKVRVIRIVGRDAVQYFQRQGLSDIRPTEEDAVAIQNGEISPEDVTPGPKFAVSLDGETEIPKFMPDQMGEGGDLYIEEGDLQGMYDYVPDVEMMRAPSQGAVEEKLTTILGTVTNPAVLQLLAAEGVKPKMEELLIKLYESTNTIKDAESYFEELPPQQPQPNLDVNQTNPAGGGGPEGGAPAQGASVEPGMEAPSDLAGI